MNRRDYLATMGVAVGALAMANKTGLVFGQQQSPPALAGSHRSRKVRRRGKSSLGSD